MPSKITTILSVFIGHAIAVNNGLARVPQMGWNNWNAFACDVSEALMLDHAKIMVEIGLRDVGYNYVLLDDCWSGGRSEDGFQFPNPKKFPNGMAHVADHVHLKGMLFGMYSSAGEMTCARDGESGGIE
jgi:alpha-galactosidase